MTDKAVEGALACGGLAAGAAGLLASSASESSLVAGWVERIGLPTALILLGGLLVVRAAKAVWAKMLPMAEKVVERHVSFVDNVEKAVKTTTDTVTCLREEAAEDRKTRAFEFGELKKLLGADADEPKE